MMRLFDLFIQKAIVGEGGGGEAVLINKDISENGTYYASTDHADGYKKVVVDVQPTLSTKTITDNGTYAASADNVQGFSSVTVAVPIYDGTVQNGGIS